MGTEYKNKMLERTLCDLCVCAMREMSGFCPLAVMITKSNKQLNAFVRIRMHRHTRFGRICANENDKKEHAKMIGNTRRCDGDDMSSKLNI